MDYEDELAHMARVRRAQTRLINRAATALILALALVALLLIAWGVACCSS